ncbi:hypothetical protein N7G274_008372 [Stereocaulon virgatum]|uniref:Uncharacterized protein n=1 Tax=Stereocaulon virgatum TaxID=373712 RepID=A0ABR4A1B1_9LECA
MFTSLLHASFGRIPSTQTQQLSCNCMSVTTSHRLRQVGASDQFSIALADRPSVRPIHPHPLLPAGSSPQTFKATRIKCTPSSSPMLHSLLSLLHNDNNRQNHNSKHKGEPYQYTITKLSPIPRRPRNPTSLSIHPTVTITLTPSTSNSTLQHRRAELRIARNS